MIKFKGDAEIWSKICNQVTSHTQEHLMLSQENSVSFLLRNIDKEYHVLTSVITASHFYIFRNPWLRTVLGQSLKCVFT